MAAATYSTLKAIREEAGLQRLVQGETPAGAVDGSNAVFTVANKPLVDNTGDDTTDENDVVLYVNDVPVTVDSIDAAAGTITAAAAPAADSDVTADYAFSAASDTYVQGLLDEATDWVNRKIQNRVILPYTDDAGANPIPKTLQTITRLYAGALMLIRDYGTSSDTDLTSKDGYQKMKLARDLIADFLEGTNDSDEPSAQSNMNSFSVATDGDIFHRDTDLDDWHERTPRDDYFMRKDC